MSKRRINPATGEVELTYREEKLVDEYIKNGGNGKQAAIAAGYGAARADQSAYQVLRRAQDQLDARKGQLCQLVSGRAVGPADSQILNSTQCLTGPAPAPSHTQLGSSSRTGTHSAPP